MDTVSFFDSKKLLDISDSCFSCQIQEDHGNYEIEPIG